MPGELPNISREWIDKIFSAAGASFAALAMDAYRVQYAGNTLYAAFAAAVGKTPDRVKTITDIPFLPIGFFKSHRLMSVEGDAELVFESSGTTQTGTSRHFVKDAGIYTRSFRSAFELFYGPVSDWCIIGLLPAYLERKHSSLVVMVDDLVRQSRHASSGFYLYEHEKLYGALQELEASRQKTLLIGVTFGLLDFAEKYSLTLRHTVVMETGGMKGRREEWTREQVHDFLRQRFGITEVHSEYGMTELLSQAYSCGNGIFHCAPWMKLLVREEDDPLSVKTTGNGLVNIIDLANIYSCSFIATDDAGRLNADGSFEIMGRRDNSDLRGCSLMAV
jgi:hypothetical protein